MSRTERLLSLLQLLRSHRYPVSGTQLAERLDISLRTLYRDIASLQSQGAEIVGEAGVGYVLRPGFMLPPLMFSEEELEAIVLGISWVAARTDQTLGMNARSALDKITAVLPQELRETLDSHTLLVGPAAHLDEQVDAAQLRTLIRTEHKAEIRYLDLKGQASTRTIWPFALGYFEQVRIVVAWCEKRQAFRHFRADRILSLVPSNQRYPQRRQQLLKQWRKVEGSKE
ncbi:YafY family transcriptional regulator [Bowmanella sp. Y26]|uniref:helix-turn-helix transcriptional regulator n=1 Tax=Bowmanella yangjiangensis TaxID=2811230 RepID=UPI001BDD957F|nr:YafY family protein [Bowmanella yangjiangensis]MBT1062139.1 YafY family transcriptional regulator [Bowmanella yangjiangensis]